MTLDERLLARAATIDEVLSDAFDQLPGQKSDTDVAARRLAAWCRSSASGDWSLFARRLQRDGLSIEDVLAKFSTLHRNPCAAAPAWIQDATWIGEALQICPQPAQNPAVSQDGPCAFADLLGPVVHQAETVLWSDVDDGVAATLDDCARACLRRSLTTQLSDLTATALYQRFAAARNDGGPTGCYDRFVSTMRTNGWQSPVRRQARAVAADGLAHPPVDRRVTGIDHAPSCRPAGDSPRPARGGHVTCR